MLKHTEEYKMLNPSASPALKHEIKEMQKEKILKQMEDEKRLNRRNQEDSKQIEVQLYFHIF